MIVRDSRYALNEFDTSTMENDHDDSNCSNICDCNRQSFFERKINQLKYSLWFVTSVTFLTLFILIYSFIFVYNFYNNEKDNIRHFLNFIRMMDDPIIIQTFGEISQMINNLPALLNCTNIGNKTFNTISLQ